jgi:thymidylate synthase ThyX
MISAKIVADSQSGSDGPRLTTFELIYPRWILAELNTHRMFSRNSASSRAIPIERVIESIRNSPAEPIEWGKNRKGMSANEILDEKTVDEARKVWYSAIDFSLAAARKLSELGVHKQIANRLIENFSHVQTILSATEFDNFFNLRCKSDAQPEIHALADAMRKARWESVPVRRKQGEWHLPFIRKEEFGNVHCSILAAMSAARCARVSYVRQNEQRDSKEEVEFTARLVESGHFSPLEHQAVCMGNRSRYANFEGWKQFRSFCEPES